METPLQQNNKNVNVESGPVAKVRGGKLFAMHLEL